jgi:hypothetical protein
MRIPSRKIMAVRLRIFQSTVDWFMFAHLSITKLIAFPTAKRKDGKTRSVGVSHANAHAIKVNK